MTKETLLHIVNKQLSSEGVALLGGLSGCCSFEAIQPRQGQPACRTDNRKTTDKILNYISMLKRGLIMITSTLSANVYAQTSPLNIGTIAAGDSIIVVYDVTINGSANPVSNQGNITGSNFTAFNTNDPKTPAANDPTITEITFSPLPVTITSIKAYQRAQGVQIQWTTETENNMQQYEVEKLGFGQQFDKIGTVSAVGNSSSPTNYGLFDANPSVGNNYYRIKAVEKSGAVKYSPTVKVSIGKANPALVIYPNPVTDNSINLQLTNLDKGLYTLKLINDLGQHIFSKVINHVGGSASETILIKGAKSGMYRLLLVNGSKQFTASLVFN
jgi:hypothetical protein